MEAFVYIDRNKTFKNKSICVINTRNGLFIKQVLKQNDGVILHSLNPLYEDIFYKNGDFLLVGVVRENTIPPCQNLFQLKYLHNYNLLF